MAERSVGSENTINVTSKNWTDIHYLLVFGLGILFAYCVKLWHDYKKTAQSVKYYDNLITNDEL